MLDSLRTCVGCRVKDSPHQLVRIVCEKRAGESLPVAVFDDEKNKPGRGAWIHPDSECLSKAHRKGAFHRAFRSRVQPQELVMTA